MKLDIIASGSKANCYVLTAGPSRLILDCGVPFKELLKAINWDYTGVDGCLLTHEHCDHSRSWPELVYAGVRCITSVNTAYTLLTPKAACTLISVGVQFKVGDWKIMAFDVQHDTPEPLCFMIEYIPTGERLVYATDTYYIKYFFPDVNYWLIECNYVTDRLLQQYRTGEIDSNLYHRLLKSHMSLENLKTYLSRQDMCKARKIVLLHLSDARSDEARMVKEIHDLTGVETIAAHDWLTVDLDLYPF